jgi:FolB domain-containing protein
MDQIFIRDLLVNGIIGINDWERQTPQKILINIVIFADLHKAGETDSLLESVNYKILAEKIQTHVETSHCLTVEALATNLASICLKQVHVNRVQVRVEKPDAIDNCRSVGVEIERENPFST